MPAIKVFLKNGKVNDFPETSRAGGSWCTTIQYKAGFVIITDAYGKETAIPSENIEQVVVENNYRHW